MPMLTTNLVSVAHGLIGFYFVFFGVWNIYHWTRIISTMINKRIPHPYLLLPIGIGWQTIAGAMIMCSMLPKIAALSLIPFSIASVCIFHSFWNFKGEHRISDITIFITNITVVIGALLMVIGPVKQLADLVY